MKLLETIRFEKGRFINLEYHQHRMNNSRKELFNCLDELNIKSLLETKSPPIIESRYKCRIIYEHKVENIEFVPYQKHAISSLKLIYCDDIQYEYKYLDREKIIELFNQKGSADDIVIVKNGFVTDSSTANLLLWNGAQWTTPKNPLLKGTQRAKLLYENKVVENEVKVIDLPKFIVIRLINAMLSFDDEVDIDISQVTN